MTDKLQESVEVLADSFQVYQEQMDNKIKHITKGETMANKSMINDMTDVTARISMLEQMLRRRDMKHIDESDTASHNDEVGTNDELVNYMRTGRVEGKSLSYSTEGIGLAKTTLNNIFDAMSYSFTLLGKVNQQETTSILTTVNIVEDDAKTAGWHNDMDKFDEDTFKVKFSAKEVKLDTCIAVVDVAKHMLEDMNDAALKEWVSHRVASDAGRLINEAILKGITAPAGAVATGSVSVEGILPGLSKEPKETVTKTDPLPGLLKMIAKLGSHLQKDAAWYMNIETFTALLSKVSTDGQPLLLKHLTDAKDEGATYTLFGKPIYLLSEMDKDAPIILANLNKGYTILKHTKVSFLHQLADSYVGKVRYSCRMRIGGTITNKKAFVLGAVA